MIYIVEDDKDIRELESYALKNSGYSVKTFDNADDFFKACEAKKPELALLDIMLPKTDGIEILTQLRANELYKDIPVIMVTAKSSELDKVKGLDMGADDYLTKPFGVMELVSRIKALLRRTSNSQVSKLSNGGIVLDDERHVVTANGAICELTYKEYMLLKLLMENKGIVFTREKIMDAVWGFDYHGETRTVDMHIKTLRFKLGDCKDSIKTVRNVGYKFEE